MQKKSIFINVLLLLVFLVASAGYLYFYTDYDVQWPTYFFIMVFYVLIFGFGVYASQKKSSEDIDGVLLAGRKLPLYLAVFTMSATWIGGGFINGTAEYTYDENYGLLWVQGPWGYALSLIVGGLLFARKMREREYKTMLDPLAERFGKKMSAVLFLPALSGELFWSAAILTALGTTFATILDIDLQSAIIVSSVIAIAYTAIGGLWAVALTDMVQLLLLVLGLLIVLPYAQSHLGSFGEAWDQYVSEYGALSSPFPTKEGLGNYYWIWWDSALLLIFGGIPWQVYFQRVLAARTPKVAVRLSIFAGIVCLLAAIPAVMIGVIGAVTDWSALGLPEPINSASILPHVVRYLTPTYIAAIGLGAIAAAVMSSVDSSILSAASMTGWNIYRPIFKPNVSSEALYIVLKKCIWIIGIAATLLALNVESVYQLWFLCSDFVYCLLFPALVCALYDPKANTYGAASGFIVAAILRFGGGESTFGLLPFLPYPINEDMSVFIPFKTLSMLAGLVTIMVVSRLTGSNKA